MKNAIYAAVMLVVLSVGAVGQFNTIDDPFGPVVVNRTRAMEAHKVLASGSSLTGEQLRDLLMPVKTGEQIALFLPEHLRDLDGALQIALGVSAIAAPYVPLGTNQVCMGGECARMHLPNIAFMDRGLAKVKSQRKYAHAVQQKPSAAIVTPPTTIPVPAEDAAAIIAIQERMRAIQVEADKEINRILARAALRAKLTPEQFETLVAQPDGKNGFMWGPKPEPVVKSEQRPTP